MADNDHRQRLAPRLILRIEARHHGTVQIQNADQRVVANQRHDQFCLGRRVTRDMSGKRMHIRHKD